MADGMMQMGGSLGDIAESDEESSELDAAKDLIAAVKSGDAKAVNLALSRHYEACKAKEENGADSEEEY